MGSMRGLRVVSRCRGGMVEGGEGGWFGMVEVVGWMDGWTSVLVGMGALSIRIRGWISAATHDDGDF